MLRLGPSVLAVSSPETPRGSGLDPVQGNTVELVVFCDDLAAEVERLRVRGLTIRREPFRHPSGHQRAYLDGPDGRPVALVDAPAH
ncbi:MAG: VOC family protein [Mycobacteriales bacterium]